MNIGGVTVTWIWLPDMFCLTYPVVNPCRGFKIFFSHLIEIQSAFCVAKTHTFGIREWVRNSVVLLVGFIWDRGWAGSAP